MSGRYEKKKLWCRDGLLRKLPYCSISQKDEFARWRDAWLGKYWTSHTALTRGTKRGGATRGLAGHPLVPFYLTQGFGSASNQPTSPLRQGDLLSRTRSQCYKCNKAGLMRWRKSDLSVKYRKLNLAHHTGKTCPMCPPHSPTKAWPCSAYDLMDLGWIPTSYRSPFFFCSLVPRHFKNLL